MWRRAAAGGRRSRSSSPSRSCARSAAALEASPGDLLLLVADEAGVAAQTLGALRLELARRFGLIAAGEWRPLWVTDFPLVEWNDDEGRWEALHHPFTSPSEESLAAARRTTPPPRGRAPTTWC